MKLYTTMFLFAVVVAAPFSSQSKEAAPETLTIIGQIPAKWKHAGVSHAISQKMFQRKFQLRIISAKTCLFPAETVALRMTNVITFQKSRCVGKSCKALAEIFVPKGVLIAKKKHSGYDDKLRGILK